MSWIDGWQARQERLAKLEALAQAVRESLCDMPDHPWIPGAAVKSVVAALAELDGPWVGNDTKASIPFDYDSASEAEMDRVPVEANDLHGTGEKDVP